MTPLHWAVENKSFMVIEEILKHGDSDLDVKDENGESAKDYIKRSRDRNLILHFCCYSGENDEDYFEEEPTNLVPDNTIATFSDESDQYYYSSVSYSSDDNESFHEETNDI
ncbi:hypothetical protein TRFO_15537 [Tritrichomonas foetus]|uniref:Uncharacterized protein n=1 Tax=Tritrichomonas foetus TaxID=1144522 RepID=A0A1J4KSH0_9EUKA|nr:hypothetical protein TRFO_15537 [Tritrichomonas foetus]|eukprot:OHT14231.1 hypothetical protein TRFO_15537 [Tritrichomonas foetus]